METLIVSIIGILSTLVATFLANRHSINIMKLEFENNRKLKTIEYNQKIINDFLSSLMNLSLLEFRTYDGKWNNLNLSDDSINTIISDYKKSLGPILSIVSNELFNKIIYADNRIDSAEIVLGIMDMNQLIPLIRSEVENHNLHYY
ncbi:hypothetical protein [Enterococcus casseliflavus]|uniref:hypothetical protein n=1 Tax=Enterococcus casseliflavus TaxID=37734 RepID=UPI0022FD82B0|nr:hypothetical protein [Enterococcus casseliflavus]WBY90930.1 hypothetical protein PEZ80_09610 [Enterococcus casseliflavus]